MTPRRSRRQAGFSVTELMVVVAILGLLAALAAPNMGAMIRTQRLKTASFDIFSSLAYARSEAIKRNTSVTLTPVNSADWAKGWRITDSNGTMLRDQSGWETVTASGPAVVTFFNSGRPNTAGNIEITAYGISQVRCVKLDLSGRAVTKEGACS